MLMLQHGMILNDPAMIPVNVSGFTLNFIYFAIYYLYPDDKIHAQGIIQRGNTKDVDPMPFIDGMVIFMGKEIIQRGNIKDVDPMPFIGGMGM
ncbi:hypothetical protein LSTR_LSTR010095 [Laodelphax striatellus]|uniref:Uncharacterized protein n=1 Tax=Laodelphax striatellus TaxID=195883 RepID=A0A482X343_LAOST|nr:hypothetical protein LSTR_LSTR010095 [Laodelphax striatellus]